MKTSIANVGRAISISGLMILAAACGQQPDEGDAVEGEINVGTSATIRTIPSKPTQLKNNPHDDSGGNFNVFVQSDKVAGPYTLGFLNTASFPVNVCGAYTCNGSRKGFDFSLNPRFSILSLPIQAADGQNCKSGATFQYSYAVSRSTVPSATCTNARNRL